MCQVHHFGNGVRIDQALDDEVFECGDLGMTLKVMSALLPGDHASFCRSPWLSLQHMRGNDSNMDDRRSVVVSQFLENVSEFAGAH